MCKLKKTILQIIMRKNLIVLLLYRYKIEGVKAMEAGQKVTNKGSNSHKLPTISTFQVGLFILLTFFRFENSSRGFTFEARRDNACDKSDRSQIYRS